MKLRDLAWATGLAATGHVVRALLRAPAPLVKRALGEPPSHGLDLQTWAMLRSLELTRTPGYHQMGLRKARRAMDAMAPIMSPRPRHSVQANDDSIPGPAGSIPIRIYKPRKAATSLPLILYFHGGGFVLGSLDSHDGVCRYLCDKTGCLVLAVAYRLAPEHRFPAALEDALAAFRWVVSHASAIGADANRIAVAGDSAGGNLSAGLSVALRGEQVSPRIQVLLYPATDLTRAMPSHRKYATGYFLDEPMIDWFVDNYLPDPEAARDPRCSPLFWEDLSNVAPALVLTAGHDPLRDEGKAYADRLIEAGVRTTHVCHEGLIHGFVSMAGGIVAAHDALDGVCRWIREQLET